MTAATKRAIAGWVAAGLLALMFIGSGTGKLLATDASVEMFQGYGYPMWFMYAVGAVEAAGGVLVLIPRATFLGVGLRAWGAGALAAVMAGAVGTHLLHAEYAMVAMPLALLALAAGLAYAARPGRSSGAPAVADASS